ncbi:MAG: cAMP-binding protein [Chitinophagales bacterium]|nr:MAG: cAMP-binding protein [Chitinophagales bacterium]
MLEHLRHHITRFISITRRDFDKLTPFFKPLYLKKKDFLFRQNEVCRYIAFVHKGCLRNYHIDNKGEEQIIYFALEDWWVADLQSFFLNIPSQFNLQALENCELLAASKPDFEQAFIAVPVFEKFYRIKTQIAYTSSQQSLVEKSETAEDRYIKLLKTAPGLVQRVPQRYLASYLGIKPQSLSRIRKKISGTGH